MSISSNPLAESSVIDTPLRLFADDDAACAPLCRPPKTAVLGASGFVGRHMLRAYRRFDREALGTTRTGGPGVSALDLADFNATEFNSIGQRLAKAGYTDVVVAGALTNVALCEQEPERAKAVNLEGPLNLARQFAAHGIKLIVFSSDYVFDGIAGGYRDETPTNPLNVYGSTKAELERRLPQIWGDNYLIIRLSKVFGLTPGDGTLLDDMASRLSRGQEVRAAEDLIFCPVYIDDVVRAVLELQVADARGVFNLCTPVAWSRLNLARSMAVALDVDPRLVQRMSLDDLGEPFRRPKRTDMICAKLHKTVSMKFASLDACLRHVASHYQARKEVA
jgi:dTDP-4-dehydrorhamnose reductase